MLYFHLDRKTKQNKHGVIFFDRNVLFHRVTSSSVLKKLLSSSREDMMIGSWFFIGKLHLVYLEKLCPGFWEFFVVFKISEIQRKPGFSMHVEASCFFLNIQRTTAFLKLWTSLFWVIPRAFYLQKLWN